MKSDIASTKEDDVMSKGTGGIVRNTRSFRTRSGGSNRGIENLTANGTVRLVGRGASGRTAVARGRSGRQNATQQTVQRLARGNRSNG